MPQSLVQVYLHIVFSTKNRKPFLKDNIREKTHAYLAGACNNLGVDAIRIGGIEDHVHICCRMSKELAISKLIGELKRESSKWVKTQGSSFGDFYWQSGYGAFSISPSHVDGLVEYIANQEEHHKQESFQDEFRRLCKKYSVEIDERYVWD